MRTLPLLRGLCWLTFASLAACHPGVRQGPPAESAPAHPPAATAPAVTPAPTTRGASPLSEIPDGTRFGMHELAALALLVNGVEASRAGLAAGRSTQRDVLTFARRMITDHTALSAQLRDVLAQLDLSARDDAITRTVRDRSNEQRAVLSSLSGRAFDTTYINTEVQYHRELIDLIDHVLLPNATRGEVRDYLTALRPAASAHLAHAEQVRATLASRR